MDMPLGFLLYRPKRAFYSSNLTMLPIPSVKGSLFNDLVMRQRQGKHIKWNWILTPVSAIKVEWDLFLQLTASTAKQFILGENYWQQIKRIQMSPSLACFFLPVFMDFIPFTSLQLSKYNSKGSCGTQINKKLLQNETPAPIKGVDGGWIKIGSCKQNSQAWMCLHKIL